VCTACWSGKNGTPSVQRTKPLFEGDWIEIGTPDKVNLYDLFDALIERVPWRTEAEMRQYQELISALREVNLFGYMAQKMEVERRNQPPK